MRVSVSRIQVGIGCVIGCVEGHYLERMIAWMDKKTSFETKIDQIKPCILFVLSPTRSLLFSIIRYQPHTHYTNRIPAMLHFKQKQKR